MVDGDLLRQLFRSFAAKDEAAFKAAAISVIREERGKNHRLLAEDLEKLLFSKNGNEPSTRKRAATNEIPRDRERDFQLVDVTHPDLDWSRLVATANTSHTLAQVVEENRRRDELAVAGLTPTQRLLFYGPPGCGKTLAASILASALGRPLVTVRFDAVVSSYLGETAANLRRVFDFIGTDRYVVLFDEFDAIGKDRDNAFEHGELKRVVNTLLQLLDADRGPSVLVAATNHEGLLDSAVWRRFDAVVKFDLPSPQDRQLMLRTFLRGFAGADLRLDILAKKLNGATGADIERLCIASARVAVLDHRTRVTMQDFAEPVNEFRTRLMLQEAGQDANDLSHRPRRTRAD